VQPRRERRKAHAERRGWSFAEAGRFVVSGLAISVVLFALSYWFQQTDFGQDFSWITYRLLQRRIAAPTGALPAVILDISRLPLSPQGITSRDDLLKILEALRQDAAAHPAGIGIDVDFAPEVQDNRAGVPPRWRFVGGAADNRFFGYCLDYSRSWAPVYLGVFRTLQLPPEQWLGLTEYAPLAAAMLVEGRAKKSLASFNEGRTMSGALAQAWFTAHEPHRGAAGTRWPFLEAISEEREGKVALRQFVVNYSLRDRLVSEAIPIDPATMAHGVAEYLAGLKDSFRDKMVLIGDVRTFTDPFENPSSGEPIPGILIHAAAACTLVGTPLYDISEPARTIADLLLAIAMLSCEAGIMMAWGRMIHEEHLLQAVTIAAVVVVLTIGLLVNEFHIVWDDFLLVAIGVIVDYFVHGFTARNAPALVTTVEKWFRAESQ